MFILGSLGILFRYGGGVTLTGILRLNWRDSALLLGLAGRNSDGFYLASK